jgi:hypothetical protein
MGEMDVEIHVFLTSVLFGGERAASRPGSYTPAERAPGPDLIGGWVGPRAGLNDMEVLNEYITKHYLVIITVLVVATILTILLWWKMRRKLTWTRIHACNIKINQFPLFSCRKQNIFGITRFWTLSVVQYSID